MFLWNSLKSHEHLNKWLLEAIWHFIFQFSTLYIHLQNTYLNQTGQDNFLNNFFLIFYVNTYELTQTLHPFANIKYTLNLFLWNSLKSHEHLNKWLLEAIWHFIFQFNTLYIHLQNTYLNQTGQDVSLPWEAPILKVNWSFDYVTKVRSRGKLLKRYISLYKINVYYV